MIPRWLFIGFFFFNDTATTEIYTLSLHDALPICQQQRAGAKRGPRCLAGWLGGQDRKSTRLNSSHLVISYAVFCLKKKKKYFINRPTSPQYTHHPRHLAGPSRLAYTSASVDGDHV